MLTTSAFLADIDDFFYCLTWLFSCSFGNLVFKVASALVDHVAAPGAGHASLQPALRTLGLLTQHNHTFQVRFSSFHAAVTLATV